LIYPTQPAGNSKIFQYNLTTANDLSTATFSGIDLPILSEDIAPEGLTVSSDGLRLFMGGGVSVKLFQYDITTVDAFQFQKFYQIKNNQVPSIQTNMPLAIIDTVGAGVIQEASGFDIRVFDSSGSPISYQIQSVNPSTGDFITWKNMATVQESEFIQLTFGNPTATDGEDADTVWADYATVFHLNETIFAADSIKDSTVNALDSSPINMDISNSVLGKIGKAMSFNGSDEAIELPFSTLLDNLQNDFIISAWIKQVDNTGIQRIFANITSWAFGVTTNSLGFTTLTIKDYNISSSITTGVFQLLAMHFDTNNDVTFYLDGVNVGTITGTSPANISTNNFTIAFIDAFSQRFNGIIDEINLRTVIPVNVDDYETTIFNNQNDNDAFWSKTPLLENGKSNFLVDDQGNRFKAVLS